MVVKCTLCAEDRPGELPECVTQCGGGLAVIWSDSIKAWNRSRERKTGCDRPESREVVDEIESYAEGDGCIACRTGNGSELRQRSILRNREWQKGGDNGTPVALILFTTLVAWARGCSGRRRLMAVFGVGKGAGAGVEFALAVLLAAGRIAVFFHLRALGADLQRVQAFDERDHSGIDRDQAVVLPVVAVAYLALMRKSASRRRERAEVAGLESPSPCRSCSWP